MDHSNNRRISDSSEVRIMTSVPVIPPDRATLLDPQAGPVLVDQLTSGVCWASTLDPLGEIREEQSDKDSRVQRLTRSSIPISGGPPAGSNTCSVCASPLPLSRRVFCSEACQKAHRRACQKAHRRERRRRMPRARSTPTKRLTRDVMRSSAPPAADLELAAAERPLACPGHDGPCPWVGCKHHLYLDVNPETGSIKLNHPGLEPDQLEESCSLAIASRGALTLEEVGRRMNLTRE